MVNTTFDIVRKIHREQLDVVIAQDSFGNMVSCFSELAKNQRFQKPSLHSVELLKSTIKRILKYLPAQETVDGEIGIEFYNKYWFPILFALHDIIMNGEDLEVRSRALNYMFDTLTEYGNSFTPEFWDTICKQLLFPTFVVLKSRSEMARFNTQDDMSVWLSTTMIQALRNMIALLSHYFETLGRMLQGFLDLLTTCINQENDTVSRIGSSCLQQLIEQNIDKFQPSHWKIIVDSIENLFELTTATELFGDYLETEETYNQHQEHGKDITANGDGGAGSTVANGAKSSSSPSRGHKAKNSSVSTTDGVTDSLSSTEALGSEADNTTKHRRTASWTVTNHNRQKHFRKTIVKCILQLLMIDTVDEILQRQETVDFSDEGSVNTNGSTNRSMSRTPSGSNGSVPPSALVIRKQVKVVGTDIYDKMPVSELLRVLVLLRKSFIFAHRFNGDKELRTHLWRAGFMKQLPNLLKQESLSAHVYISVLLRLYTDENKMQGFIEEPIYVEDYDKEFPTQLIKTGYENHVDDDDEKEKKKYNGTGKSSTTTTTIKISSNSELKTYIESQLIPMTTELLSIFDRLDNSDMRAIQAWTPVIICVLEGLLAMRVNEFSRVIEGMYNGILGVMNRDMPPTLRIALQGVFERIGQVVFKGKK